MNVRRTMRWAAIAGVTLVGLAGGLFWGLRHALLDAPDFYVQAVSATPTDAQQAGREFERSVLALHNDLQRSGHWQREFTDAQINGWLAVDLPRKFPELLPPTIQDPRVAILPQRFQVAFHYEDEKLSAVVSLELEVGLAEEPNTLMVHVCKARAGWIPLPLNDFLDQISLAARRADISLRWAQQDGDPVAIITIPHEHATGSEEPFIVETIKLVQGKLIVAGKSGGKRRK